jgi:N-methylhydantoinase B
MRLAVAEDIPANVGSMRPITVLAPRGTVVNAEPPAAVAGGNVETSQRIVDVALAALAQVLPDRIPAASQGTMNNVTVGGWQNGPFAYYETLAGGSGAGPGWQGTSAVQVHMTNTRNTPIEALERAAPVRIDEYSIRPGTGGAGQFQGGDGMIRTYHFLAPVEVSILSERRHHQPYGLSGGEPGATGENRLTMPGGEERTLPAKIHEHLPAGARLTILTPGGGGWGKPAVAIPESES